MAGIEDETLDRASRVVYLFELGIHSAILKAAIGRASDGEALGAILGFIEDALDIGVTFSDPDE